MLTSALTDKERQTRGLDALGNALRPLIDDRMMIATTGRPWVPVYEAKESSRLGRPYRADADDPRLLLRLLRFERAVFTEIDATQRAWIDELIQSSNRCAHASTMSRAEADRALDTMGLLADSFDLDDVASALASLKALGAVDDAAHPVDSAPAESPSSTNGADSGDRNAGGAESDRDPGRAPAARRVPVDTPPARGIRMLSARMGELDVVTHYREAVNYALAHNRVSPIAAVTVINNGDAEIDDVTLTFELDTPAALAATPVAAPLEIPIGTIGSGDRLEVPGHQLAWRLNPAPFVALDEAILTGIHLTAQVGTGSTGHAVRDSADARLLTADEWWSVDIPENLAAFVRPNDPAILTLLTATSELLLTRTGSPSLEGYQSGPDRVHQIAEAVYDAMAALRIAYVEPPASFEGTGQRIRTHAQVLGERRGTCLDLACTFAAALEQAGVHAILAVVDGHAFTGYLTEETELQGVSVADPGAIVTIADSDVFDAVETTAVCDRPAPIAFDDARGLVRHWWRGDLDKINHLLDVHAAHRRVRPLPSIRVVDGVRVVEVFREAVQAPLRRVPTVAETRVTSRATSIPPRFDRWQRALLDMTYVNPLLKLRKSSSTPVHVPSGGLARLEDKLSDGQRIGLVSHDEVAEIHRAQGARTAADVDADALRQILEEESTLFVALSDHEYATRLRNLQRKARLSLEESGTDSLYLTLGILEWSERGKEGRAPLFLAPVRIVGGRGGTPFTIELDDTRAMEPNYCLVEKLRVTWGLEIPELTDPGEDESGIDIENGLAAIRSALLRAKALMFRVEEEAHLALLQFATLEMWRDLRENWSRFMARPVVGHLVETPGQTYLDNIEPPGLDSTVEATAFLPIPADGSQIEAVRWAAAGKSFILEGPPGTGKSQTITNLIAHCMAEGKKVLFVAEKQAALDVVKKRLDAVGLGALSLDLHGKSQTVTAVRGQISEALDKPAPMMSSWEAQRSNYRTLVESLARYPKQLHEVGPVDMSAWEARQVVLELEEIVAATGTPSLAVPRAVVMGQVSLPEIYEAARDLGTALLDLGTVPDNAPWRLAGPIDPASLDRHAIASALKALHDADDGVDEPAVRAMTAFATSSAEFDALGSWLDSVQIGLGRASGEAAQIVSPAWRGQVQQAQAAINRFQTTRGPQLGAFRPTVLDIDLDAFLSRAVDADGRIFGKKKRRRAIIAELQGAMHGPAPFPLHQLTAVLRRLAALRDESRGLVQHVASLPGISLPFGWNPLDPEQAGALESAIRGLEVAAHLRDVIGAGSDDTASARASVDQMTPDLLQAGDSQSLPNGDTVRRLGAAWNNFVRELGSTAADGMRWLSSRTRGHAFFADGQQWIADASGDAFIGLQRWLRVRFALARLEALGLGVISEPVRTGALRGSEVENAIRLAVSRAVLDERLDSTGLSGFDENERDRLVQRFLSTGEDVRDRMVAELSARIVRTRTFDAAARTGMVAELRQQLGRRRGGLSVRRLLHRFAALVTQITPCFLMSPASVARFLPADAIDFDVVVFDEASQIRVPEAIGSMGRGRSVVIVGDSKQMPPSSMFAAAGTDEDEDDPVDEALPVPVDLESILSEGVESRLPRLLLTWHYRSRDESLIAFSNSHYYDGRLSSFPTPPISERARALFLRRVQGMWEGGGRGAARINRAEAETVVAEIRRLLAERPEQSIGVVTFNSQQRDHILNLLDEVRQQDAHVENAFSREDEPLFVKNLENVQGDERDSILFTLAFAADRRGRVPLNWGPLSRAGGERRLNVAVTRAKEQVIVFCSFDPHELDLTRSSSQGLADLKDYLLAARNGVEAAGLRRTEARDRHLEDIENELLATGLEVRRHIGLSDFTVDLAVRAGDDQAWIAVMLDGPAWADRGSVGDREGLPATVLAGRMGWSRVERVWLPTWVRDRASVVRALVTAADEATQEATNRVPEPPRNPADAAATSSPEPAAIRGGERITTPSDHNRPVQDEARQWGGPDQVNDHTAVPIRDAALSTPAKHPSLAEPSRHNSFAPASMDMKHGTWVLDEHNLSSRSVIREEISDVIQAEGPVLGERLARIVAARFGLARVRESRRELILALGPQELASRAPNGDTIYWPGGVDADAYTGFRRAGIDVKRDIADVPYHELRNAMIECVRGAHGMSMDDALRETARLFGVVRLGTNVRERLEGVLHHAFATEGLLAEREGFISEAKI